MKTFLLIVIAIFIIIIGEQRSKQLGSVDPHVHKMTYPVLDFQDIVSPSGICKICTKAFNSKKEWLYHHETFHRTEYVSFCGECCKAFKSMNGSAEHRMKFHSTADDKMFTCSICGSKHTTANKLRIHERSHSTDKPFRCVVCNKSYKHKKDVNSHVCNLEVVITDDIL